MTKIHFIGDDVKCAVIWRKAGGGTTILPTGFCGSTKNVVDESLWRVVYTMAICQKCRKEIVKRELGKIR